MSRILADLPDNDIEELDVRSRDNRSWIERGAGYWKDRKDIGDGVEYQRAIREDRTPYEDI
jgi:hypothetical protein